MTKQKVMSYSMAVTSLSFESLRIGCKPPISDLSRHWRYSSTGYSGKQHECDRTVKGSFDPVVPSEIPYVGRKAAVDLVRSLC